MNNQKIDYNQMFLPISPIIAWKNYAGREIEIVLTVEINTCNRPDCCVGHFGYNFFVRTPKGMKGEKYKTLSGMKTAIKRALKKHYNIDILRWENDSEN